MTIAALLLIVTLIPARSTELIHFNGTWRAKASPRWLGASSAALRAMSRDAGSRLPNARPL
jgi:hypothetical protein